MYCNIMQCSTLHYNTMQCNTIQSNVGFPKSNTSSSLICISSLFWQICFNNVVYKGKNVRLKF